MNFKSMACVVLAAAGCFAVVARADEVPSWAHVSLSDWYAAYNRRDAEALAVTYLADARANDWRGREQIVEGLKQEWQRDDFVCTGRWTEMRVVDDVAVGWGEDACRPRRGGGPLTDTEWLSVHRLQPDGQWLEELSVWNLPSSPPGAERDIPPWAHVHLTAIYDAYNSRNAEAIAAHYARNGRINDWIGHQAIIDGYERLWKTSDEICTGRWLALKFAGNVGIGWGEDVCRPKTAAAAEASQSPWLSLMERQPDGRWLETLTVWPTGDASVAVK